MTLLPLRPALQTRLARLLVRGYPRLWRARYADELLDLLEARSPNWADLCDLAANGLYAHLHPDLSLTGDETPEARLTLYVRALRASELTIFGAFVAAVIAWLQLGGLVDGGPYMALMSADAPWPLVSLDWGNPLNLTMEALSVAADLAFLCALIGGVPLAIVAWRRSPRSRRLLLAPVASLIGAILPGPILILLAGRDARINLTFETPITIAYLVWFLALASVSAWAIMRAVFEGEAPERLTRFAYALSAGVTLALLLMFGATLAWGVEAHLHAPQLFDRLDLAPGYATLPTWALDALVMAASTLVAAFATVRGWLARAALPAAL